LFKVNSIFCDLKKKKKKKKKKIKLLNRGFAQKKLNKKPEKKNLIKKI